MPLPRMNENEDEELKLSEEELNETNSGQYSEPPAMVQVNTADSDENDNVHLHRSKSKPLKQYRGRSRSRSPKLGNNNDVFARNRSKSPKPYRPVAPLVIEKKKKHRKQQDSISVPQNKHIAQPSDSFNQHLGDSAMQGDALMDDVIMEMETDGN
eukprot:331347_1